MELKGDADFYKWMPQKAQNSKEFYLFIQLNFSESFNIVVTVFDRCRYIVDSSSLN